MYSASHVYAPGGHDISVAILASSNELRMYGTSSRLKLDIARFLTNAVMNGLKSSGTCPISSSFLSRVFMKSIISLPYCFAACFCPVVGMYPASFCC